MPMSNENLQQFYGHNDSIVQWLAQHPDSTVEEMRFLRREIINRLLRTSFVKQLHFITHLVRAKEVMRYGQELQVYK